MIINTGSKCLDLSEIIKLSHTSMEITDPDLNNLIIDGSEIGLYKDYHARSNGMSASCINKPPTASNNPFRLLVIGMRAIDSIDYSCLQIYFDYNGSIYKRMCYGGEWGEWGNLDSKYNDNLLDNPNFKINQRGQTEYIGTNNFTVDRWAQYPSTCKVIVNNTENGSGIILRSTSDIVPENTYVRINQGFEEPLVLGEKYTLSVNLDGITYIINFNATEEFKNHSFGNYKYTIYTSISGIIIQLNGGYDQVNIQWVKLEYGSTVTAFIPPNPATELVKCQRFYKEIVGSFKIMGMNSDILFSTIGSIENMRVIPTGFFKTNVFNGTSGVRIVALDGTARMDVFSFGISVNNNEGTVGISATKSQHGLDHTQCFLVIDKNNPICLSAEL